MRCKHVKTLMLVSRVAGGVPCDRASCFEKGRRPRAAYPTTGPFDLMPSVCEARRLSATVSLGSARLPEQRLVVAGGSAASVGKPTRFAILVLLALSASVLGGACASLTSSLTGVTGRSGRVPLADLSPSVVDSPDGPGNTLLDGFVCIWPHHYFS